MDLHPDIQAAAAHVREVLDLGVTYFDCARSYWDGRSEEPYGIGLQGVRKDVFLTTKTQKRTAEGAERDLETSLRLLKTDFIDLWQVHSVETRDDIKLERKWVTLTSRYGPLRYSGVAQVPSSSSSTRPA